MVAKFLSNTGALYRDNDELHLRFRPPTANAVYYVLLIGNWASDQDEDGAAVYRTNSLPIIKWKVDARNYSAAAGLNGRFPESNGVEFGATQLAIKRGVRASVINGIIRADTG